MQRHSHDGSRNIVLAEVRLHDPVDYLLNDSFLVACVGADAELPLRRLCERSDARQEKNREHEANTSRVANHGTHS